MDTGLIDFVLSLAIMALRLATVRSKEDDVCLRTTFNATCPENEVIQMEHAIYGRMAVGRCIPENVGFMMGCQEDVLSYLDSVCSGRQTCQLRLEDYLSIGPQPCQPGLESYLNLRYKCIRVHAPTAPCAGAPLLVLGVQGMLSNFITGRTGQGSQDCPWEVRGSPGQKIRLTLHDYGVWAAPTSEGGGSEGNGPSLRLPGRSDICHIYAKATEADGSKNPIPLCGGEKREKVVYLSETEGVRIAIPNPQNSQNPVYFLLRFEITGCPDYIPPEGAVTTRHENTISVNCPDTGSKWRVTCEGTIWTTENKISACTIPGGETISIGALFQSAQTMPQWILIVVIIAAALIIAVPIVVIGILSFRRRHGSLVESDRQNQMRTDKFMLHVNKEQEPMLDKNEKTHNYIGGREYTNTAQRHMAVRPGVVVTSGIFPPLPLPPTGSAPNPGDSTHKGTLSYKRCPQGSHHATLKEPHAKHNDESPNTVRLARSTSDASGPFYHELDPEHTIWHPITQRQHKECDKETPDIEP